MSAPAANRWLITLAVSSGAFMGALDASITYVALPEIRGSLGATLAESTWMNTSFIIATAVVLPLTGFVSRQLGQKRTYLLSLALFTVSSLLCGACRSLLALAVCRGLQGVAMGILSPAAQAILQQLFPPRQRGMAMAIFTMMIVVGPAVGPVLGGVIISRFQWPWIFAINAPVGVLGFAMVWRLLGDDHDRDHGAAAGRPARGSLDWRSLALMTLALASFQYVLEDGLAEDWFESPRITALTVLAAGCAAAFAVRSLRSAHPVVELRLFRDPVYRSGALLGGVAYLVVSVNLFLVPVFLQEVLGFTPLEAGMALVSRAAVMVVAIPLVGALYNHVAPRTLVGLGLVIKAAGVYALTSIHLQTGLAELVGPLLLQGLGGSLIFVPLNAVIFTNVPASRTADAAGISLMTRHLGSSVGLALVATFLSIYAAEAREGISATLFVERVELRELTALLAAPEATIGAGPGEGASEERGDELPAYRADPRVPLLAGVAGKQATVMAARQLFALAAWLLVCTLPFLLFLRPGGAAAAGAHVPVGEA